MIETEPKYFTEFKKEFREFAKHVDDKIETEVGELALITSQNFERIEKNMVTKDDLQNELNDFAEKYDLENMATKEDLREATEPILKHIGAYEIRAKNVDDILLKDHKPRIADLEKEVFAL